LLCPEPRNLDPHIYLYEDAAAVRHLLRVTAGLDSMVLGETEITGQIKNAYEIARNAGLTGRVLNRLFQRAFQATKEIRTRTGIGRGTVSIKSTAAELIGKTDLSQQSIMVLGAGAMAESCVRLLVKKGARSIFISSRSLDRALDLATRCGGEAVCFGYSLFEMREVDAVIAATSSSETLLSRDDAENLMKARRQRPLLLIDLAVPRNIEAAVGDLDGVSLYNIDDLEALAREGVQNRERELAACHQIIEAHIRTLIERFHAENEQRHETSFPHEFSTASGLLLQAS
jgi:glutamyl-tRNA reductase